MILRRIGLPLVTLVISGEMMVDGMAAGRFGYSWLHRLNFMYRQNKNPVKSIYLF